MKLSTKDLIEVFGVTLMTINNWRFPNKSAQKLPLPFHTEAYGSTRHKVYFEWKEVKIWARLHNVKIVKHPDILNAEKKQGMEFITKNK